MKTDVPYKTAGDLRSADDPSPAIDDFKSYVADVWFCFRHKFFKKKYDENQIWSERECVCTQQGPHGDGPPRGPPRRSQVQYLGTAAIQICFRHNFSKNYPQDLKMV